MRDFVFTKILPKKNYSNRIDWNSELGGILLGYPI